MIEAPGQFFLSVYYQAYILALADLPQIPVNELFAPPITDSVKEDISSTDDSSADDSSANDSDSSDTDDSSNTLEESVFTTNNSTRKRRNKRGSSKEETKSLIDF